MKKILRLFFINLIALKIIAETTGCLTFNEGFKTLTLGAAILAVFELILKPLLRILLLPINILTLGLVRWVINVVGLFLAAHFVSSLIISPYYFPGYNQNGLILPRIQFSLLATFILLSFFLDIITTIIRWLFRK